MRLAAILAALLLAAPAAAVVDLQMNPDGPLFEPVGLGQSFDVELVVTGLDPSRFATTIEATVRTPGPALGVLALPASGVPFPWAPATFFPDISHTCPVWDPGYCYTTWRIESAGVAGPGTVPFRVRYVLPCGLPLATNTAHTIEAFSARVIYSNATQEGSGGLLGGDTLAVSYIDGDLDGLADGCDKCQLVPDPLQLDADGDGCGDLCDADFNNDGAVGPPDWATFRPCFGAQAPLGACAIADINSDGAVGPADFGIFSSLYGLPTGPSYISNPPACP